MLPSSPRMYSATKRRIFCAEIGSSAQFAVLDGRTFVFLPYEQYRRSKVYEIDANGRATEHLDVLGDVFKWIRVR